jgi:hypothetical protein
LLRISDRSGITFHAVTRRMLEVLVHSNDPALAGILTGSALAILLPLCFAMINTP